MNTYQVKAIIGLWNLNVDQYTIAERVECLPLEVDNIITLYKEYKTVKKVLKELGFAVFEKPRKDKNLFKDEPKDEKKPVDVSHIPERKPYIPYVFNTRFLNTEK